MFSVCFGHSMRAVGDDVRKMTTRRPGLAEARGGGARVRPPGHLGAPALRPHTSLTSSAPVRRSQIHREIHALGLLILFHDVRLLRAVGGTEEKVRPSPSAKLWTLPSSFPGWRGFCERSQIFAHTAGFRPRTLKWVRFD
jgi:hypothetical protein